MSNTLACFACLAKQALQVCSLSLRAVACLWSQGTRCLPTTQLALLTDSFPFLAVVAVNVFP